MSTLMTHYATVTYVLTHLIIRIPYKLSSIIIQILQMNKLNHREVKRPALQHTALKWQRWLECKTRLSDSKVHALPL